MSGARAGLGIDETIPGVADAIIGRSGKPDLPYLGKTVPW
jgi:hypothetical protein